MVVVAEDGECSVGGAETAQRGDETGDVPEPGPEPRVRGEVAGERDEIRLFGVDAVHQPEDASGGHPAVHVQVAHEGNAVSVKPLVETRQDERDGDDLHVRGLNLPRVDQTTHERAAECGPEHATERSTTVCTAPEHASSLDAGGRSNRPRRSGRPLHVVRRSRREPSSGRCGENGSLRRG